MYLTSHIGEAQIGFIVDEMINFIKYFLNKIKTTSGQFYSWKKYVDRLVVGGYYIVFVYNLYRCNMHQPLKYKLKRKLRF